MKYRIQIIFFVFLTITCAQSCKTIDATIGAKEYCRVHDQKMKKTRTFIKYGYRIQNSVSTDFFEYPNPKINYFGGCVVRKGRPRIYKYYFCTQCNKAKEKEKEKHENTTFYIRNAGFTSNY